MTQEGQAEELDLDGKIRALFETPELPKYMKNDMWSNIDRRTKASEPSPYSRAWRIRPVVVGLGTILAAIAIAYVGVRMMHGNGSSLTKVTPTQAATLPKQPDKSAPKGQQLGSIHLGDSLTRAQKLYGDPVEETTFGKTQSPEWIFSHRTYMYGNPIWQIIANSPQAGDTARGIRVGSTVARLKRAYHGLLSGSGRNYGKSTLYLRRTTYSIRFVVTDGHVSQIVIDKIPRPS